jgi:hypothetical protein
MRMLSDSDLLGLWEAGARRHPLDRALLTLGAALPETPYDGFADWPLGRRNRTLAELRCSTFGDAMRAWVACPRCAEKLEFEVSWPALASGGIDADAAARPIVVGRHSFRLPTSRDLAQAAKEDDPHLASIHLIESCRIEPEGFPAWSDEDLEEIGARMALADPQAETRLALNCPSCANRWEETLDIASLLWEEIEARARRILLEVHTLASAYGWVETEILLLSANRRASYLAMVQA